MEGLIESGLQFIVSLQQNWDWSFSLMKILSFMGTQEFYLLFMPIILWSIDYGFGFRIGVMLMTAGSITEIFKIALVQPRPYWVSLEVNPLSKAETGFGLPSGHSALPISIYGLMAATIKQRRVTFTLLTLVALIGISRMVLGMHFPQDVLGGWLLGLLLLGLFLKYEPAVKAWFSERSLNSKISTMFIITALVSALAILIATSINPDSVPAEWYTNALASYPDDPIHPLNPESVITSTGALFGLTAGWFLFNQKGSFNTKGSFGQHLGRIVIGILGVLVFWRGLDAVFPAGADLLGWSFRYVRYALTTAWISGGAPWVFNKLKLATTEETAPAS